MVTHRWVRFHAEKYPNLPWVSILRHIRFVQSPVVTRVKDNCGTFCYFWSVCRCLALSTQVFAFLRDSLAPLVTTQSPKNGVYINIFLTFSGFQWVVFVLFKIFINWCGPISAGLCGKYTAVLFHNMNTMIIIKLRNIRHFQSLRFVIPIKAIHSLFVT